MAEQLERSLAQLAEAIKAKAKATTPPASQQIQDPKRPTTSGVVASKTFEYRDGRRAGFVETSGDGARTRQVFERDKAGRITKIVTMPAGATPPGAAVKSRGGFLPPALPEPEYSRMMAAMHKAAWTEFVAKHARPR